MYLRKRNRIRRQMNERRNRHHLIPRSRGGRDSYQNLLLIDMDRHEAWHRLWGNRTIEEVLCLLERVARAKANQQKVA